MPAAWSTKGLTKAQINNNVSEFKIEVINDKIYYTPEGKEAVDSGLYMENVLDYYLLCDELIKKEDLYRAPITEDNKYDHVKYCSFCQIAEKVNGNFTDWKNKVKKL